MQIVRMLGQRHSGYTREEISSQTGLPANGDLTKMFKALVGSDFVIRYVPYGDSLRKEHYKPSDCFCWFWLHFKEKKNITESDYWQHHLKESEITSWRGIAFEEVCLQHIHQIKMSLQIAGVTSRESSLIVRGEGDNRGMQINLLIDRADDILNVCEMKFCRSSFSVTKAYADTLSRRQATLEADDSSKTVHMTLISASPLERNEYSDIFLSTIVIDDLFVSN